MEVARQATIEKFFHILDESSTYIAEQFQKSYLEALIDTAESMFQQEFVLPGTAEQKTKLENLYRSYPYQRLTREERRRSFQLAMLKGMKDQAVPGTGVTPDAVCMFIAYLAKQLSRPQSIYDPAVGSGNLLTCVMNQYENAVQGWGTEVDALTIRLAYANANLQHQSVELYHQDCLKNEHVPVTDLIVCDLPVGMYPDEQTAKMFEMYADDHPAYTHHLIIEKSLQMCREGGYQIFLIPNTLFTEPGADKLRELIRRSALIQAVLQLPQSLFREGSIQKSIFILQKKGRGVQAPKQTLMAQLPSFKDGYQMSRILGQIRDWLKENK